MKSLLVFFIAMIFSSCAIDCKYLDYVDGITYLNGFKYSGDCSSYYPDGVLSSNRSYKNGLDNGKWEFFHPNGNAETLGNYSNGKRIGRWEYYFESGELKQLSFYKKGLKDSIWTNYLLNGDPLWEKEFKNDTLKGIINYKRFR